MQVLTSSRKLRMYYKVWKGCLVLLSERKGVPDL